MDVKIQARVSRLEVSTSLSPADLAGLQTKLDSLGVVGEQALKIARGLAEVLSNIEGATGDLKLIALEAENGARSLSLTFEASSAGATSKSLDTTPSNLGAQTRIGDMGLSSRARKAIIRLGSGCIATAGDLANYSEDELAQQKSCGEVTVGEIKHKLGAVGLRLRSDSRYP